MRYDSRGMIQKFVVLLNWLTKSNIRISKSYFIATKSNNKRKFKTYVKNKWEVHQKFSKVSTFIWRTFPFVEYTVE